MDFPPERVLAAFGLSGDADLLPGGQGETWRAGDVVLKPVGLAAEAEWRAEVLAGLPEGPGFRVARPVRTIDGWWIADGWEASALLEGATDTGRPDDVLTAGAAFHEAVAGLPRPAFLDERDDPWTYADQVAWDERPVEGSTAYREVVERLVRARGPVDPTAAQAVHGDLLGNVMFAPGLPPAIIDWAVYWRPPAWAAAVAVVDALCWYDAKPELVTRWSHLPDWDQMLVRALIYRITTDEAAAGESVWTPRHRAAYEPVVDLVTSGGGLRR
ncbi:TIGR02569 family protein [Kribbella sp. CA-247076]|uniref:TIGR02569 family protein n=1 Tax=Kribbella sp. CA-247076 TaxID=3239941 RepID=UPI003D8A72E5